jgi:hypothetical protein
MEHALVRQLCGRQQLAVQITQRKPVCTRLECGRGWSVRVVLQECPKGRVCPHNLGLQIVDYHGIADGCQHGIQIIAMRNGYITGRRHLLEQYFCGLILGIRWIPGWLHTCLLR